MSFWGGKTSSSVFLDIGCGSGYVLNIAKKKFKKLIGIDISIKMLLKAIKKGFNPLCGDVNHLSVKTNSIDVVSAFSVVHHLYSPSLMFEEAFRVLKRNGYFYTDNDPNLIATDLHNLGKQSSLYRIYMGLYYLPLRFSKVFNLRKKRLKEFDVYLKKNNISQEKYNELGFKAEYYLNNGVDSSIIQQQLAQVGFTDIQIFYHFSGKKLRESISFLDKAKILFKMFLKGNFSYLRKRIPLKELAPFFAIIARKP